MEYIINNAELAILSLIDELGNCNGYQLRQLVKERGYDAWSGVSSSSIYITLKKLEKREFVHSLVDLEKKTKGPTGKIFNVTNGGREVLHNSIKQALSSAREHDPRYNLALCGIEFLPNSVVLDCFYERQKKLKATLLELEHMASMKMPLSAHLLYGRIIKGLKAEIDWVEDAKKQLSD